MEDSVMTNVASLVATYPKVALGVAILASLIALFHSARLVFAQFAKETPETWDDALSDKIEKSRVTKAIDYVGDLLAKLRLKK